MPASQKLLAESMILKLAGKAPFLVMSKGLEQLDLFFQGQKIPVQSQGSKTIQLEQAAIP